VVFGLFSAKDSEMSSTLRLSIIAVLFLATAALGLIAYNMNLPKPVVQVTENTPAAPPPAPPPAPVTVGYFVAAHPLPAGTLAREEDFTVRSVSPDSVPSGAIIDTPEVRIGLRGSLVRTFLDTGGLVTSQNVLRPRDRGFLANVLAPGTRAISIKVDTESGVSGLIWPGDYVDIVVTHSATPTVMPPANRPSSEMSATPSPSPPGVSETVLRNVRIIAIDQEIMQGVPANNATAGKETRTVSLQLAPEQVETITVAQHLGKLSLAARAVEQPETVAAGPMFSGDVPPKTDPARGYIKVYNSRGLNSYTLYRCGSSGCDKAAEENSKSSDAQPDMTQRAIRH
jgi:pilus assembly protein CpaB